MPEVDGLELLEMIKDDPDLKAIPVIMMSGNNEMDSIYACIDKGAVDFLIKPIRPGALKGLIS